MSSNILIVEDERIVAMEIEEQVRNLGYNVVGLAATSDAALRLVRSAGPDLALMDIRIEGPQDGVECVETLRRFSDMPVIYLTALADTISMGRATRTKPSAFLVKPIRDEELKAAIEIALFKRDIERALDLQRAEFAIMLNHDIQSPLQVVSGCAELLAAELEKAQLPFADDLLQRMRRGLADTGKLVADYLALITVDPQRGSRSNVCLAVNQAIEQMRGRFEAEAWRRGVSFDVKLADGAPLIEIHRIALERMVANLVYNALKFTRRGGRVGLSCESAGGELTIVVTDTGAGIAPEDLPYIFTKGWRSAAMSAVEGTGLGLYVVKTLVESLGGRVEVISEVGRGSCFKLFLPAAPPLQ